MKRLAKILLVVLIAAYTDAQAQRLNFKTTRDSIIAKNKKLIEINPDDLAAHDAFLASANYREIQQQYAQWMKMFPKSAIVPFAVGKYFHDYEEGLKGQGYLIRAVELNPNLAEAWNMMSLTTNDYDHERAQKYGANAVNLEPDNSDYAFTYAYSFKEVDSTKFDSLLTKIVYDHPRSEASVRAYFYLINNTTDAGKKERYYLSLLNGPPDKLSQSYNNRMEEYYNYLLPISLDKAHKLATRLGADRKHVMYLTGWKNRAIFAQDFMRAQNFLLHNKIDSAKVLLDSIKITDKSVLYNAFSSMRAKVMGAERNTAGAYKTIIKLYSKLPTDSLRILVLHYGSEMGLTEREVMADIWKLRDSTLLFANDFKLKSFLNNDSVSLSNFRGKVILLTYWFPGCSPCRYEFPFFEAALKKINNANVVYLGANLLPLQDREVMPLVRLNKYTFISLHDSWERTKENLAAYGAPTNYLIDQEGKIVFFDFRIDQDNERTLELMISEMLNRPHKLDSIKANQDSARIIRKQ